MVDCLSGEYELNGDAITATFQGENGTNTVTGTLVDGVLHITINGKDCVFNVYESEND